MMKVVLLFWFFFPLSAIGQSCIIDPLDSNFSTVVKAQIGRLKNTALLNTIFVQSGLNIDCSYKDDSGIVRPFIVSSYKYKLSRNGERLAAGEVKGHLFDSQFRTLLMTVRAGDVFNFYDIFISVPNYIALGIRRLKVDPFFIKINGDYRPPSGPEQAFMKEVYNLPRIKKLFSLFGGDVMIDRSVRVSRRTDEKGDSSVIILQYQFLKNESIIYDFTFKRNMSCNSTSVTDNLERKECSLQNWLRSE